MRRTTSLLLAGSAFGLVAFASACQSDPPVLYARVDWKLQCDRTMGMCRGYDPHCVNAYDGDPVEEGCDVNTPAASISCNVTETDDTRTLSFSVSTASYGISLTGAQFPRAGGSPSGTGCGFQIREDNTYSGSCGGLPVSDTQQCQITNVEFTTDPDSTSPLVQGLIYCEKLQTPADRTILRGVSSRTSPTQAFSFKLYDCNGYTPD